MSREYVEFYKVTRVLEHWLYDIKWTSIIEKMVSCSQCSSLTLFLKIHLIALFINLNDQQMESSLQEESVRFLLCVLTI